jgi:hypothetical protein
MNGAMELSQSSSQCKNKSMDRVEPKQGFAHGDDQGPPGNFVVPIDEVQSCEGNTNPSDGGASGKGMARATQPRPKQPVKKSASMQSLSPKDFTREKPRLLDHQTLYQDRIFNADDWAAHVSHARYMFEPLVMCALPMPRGYPSLVLHAKQAEKSVATCGSYGVACVQVEGDSKSDASACMGHHRVRWLCCLPGSAERGPPYP